MTSTFPEFSEECFFIAPIGEESSEIRTRSDQVLKHIVSKVAEELGFTAVRADQISRSGQINLQVIQHVCNAKIAVADLTGINPNVLYEVGVRHSFRLPLVIIADKSTTLPFDIANMRTIFFDHTDLDSVEFCKEEIRLHIENELSGGESDNPIVTSANVIALASGSTVERAIADLTTSLEEVAKSQKTLLSMMQSIQNRSSGGYIISTGSGVQGTIIPGTTPAWTPTFISTPAPGIVRTGGVDSSIQGTTGISHVNSFDSTINQEP